MNNYKQKAIHLKRSGHSNFEIVGILRVEGCKRGYETISEWVRGVRDLRIEVRNEKTIQLKARLKELKEMGYNATRAHKTVVSEGYKTRLDTVPSYPLVVVHFRKL